MKHFILGLATVAVALSADAQHFGCGTDQIRLERIANDPTYLEREARYAEEIRELVTNSLQRGDREEVVTIPIVFHIVHLGGDENITNEQILNQVDLLNQDFSATNPDISQVYESFQPIIGDAQIRFALPTIDPYGNCTNGIVRHMSPTTNRGNDGAKKGPWPRQKYLNVWTVNNMDRAGVAGYAYYPSALEGIVGQLADGIILQHTYVGDIGTSNPFRSTALSHEIGHYLNLAHVWGNNNGQEEGQPPPFHMVDDCGDDNVEDTPITRGWNTCRTSQTNQSPELWADCDRQAFQNALFNFDEVNTGSGTTDPAGAIEIIDEPTERLRTRLEALRAVGVSANSVEDGRFAFTDWDGGALDGETDPDMMTGAINSSKYYAFAVDPQVADVTTLSSFSFMVDRNETGARSFAVRTSLNNFGTNIAITANDQPNLSILGTTGFFTEDLTGPQMVTVTLPVASYANLLDPISFRIYAWNSEDAGGTFTLDDFQVEGEGVRIENVQNYMEYSYCSNMFSMGQVDRMRGALNSATGDRNMTWTEENLQATGIAEGFEGTCAPIADFYPRVSFNGTSADPYTPTVCVGEDVRFIDNSGGAFPTAWAWTFQDGDPATSNERNPTVSFNTPGWKTVTLTASNDNGSDTMTKDYSILIGGSPNDVAGLYQESFENSDILFPFNYFNYADNITVWERTTIAAHTGNACARLNSGTRNPLDLIDSNNDEDYDDMISPTYDLSNLLNGQFSFYYAYNTTINQLPLVTERLEVSSSTDCGKTWISRANITGADLINNGLNGQVPPAAWAFRSFDLPPSLRARDVRFRFRFVSSSFSGDLFIDDINITGAVGIEDMNAENFMNLYPNPTNDRFNLAVYGMDQHNTNIIIQDMRGAVVFSTVRQPAGGAGMDFSGKELGLAEGMYLIRASNEKGNSAQKLIIGR